MNGTDRSREIIKYLIPPLPPIASGTCACGRMRSGQVVQVNKTSRSPLRNTCEILEEANERLEMKHPNNDHDDGNGGTSPETGPSASFCEISPRLWKSFHFQLVITNDTGID